VTASRPQFSIVAAVYNVKPYLDQFIASIERQQVDPGRLEVVMVDDGSTDGSRAVIDAWAARRPGLVRVVGKPNGGQASARNLGLEHATGEWVTFSDPDDMLHPAFFARAVAFLETHPDIELLAARPVVLDEQPESSTSVPTPTCSRAGRISACSAPIGSAPPGSGSTRS
jgi:glycosyltransferase involved in cell wall biosynthesis